jgi:ribonucleoside-diphosphate reductase alpha chain
VVKNKMDADYTGALHTYVFKTLANITTPAIVARYSLKEELKNELHQLKSPLTDDPYRYAIYLRTYSRLKKDGNREEWADTVIRVIEGTMAAYIDHMKKNGLFIDYQWVDQKAEEMAISLYKLEWITGGRGLYAMGTDFTYEYGNAALNNCYATDTKDLVKALSFTIAMSALGGGVGFDTSWAGEAIRPNKADNFIFVIGDTRESWTAALELLVRAYVPVDGKITNKFPLFQYHLIRPAGTPIVKFHGVASGPEPLRILLARVEIFFDTYLDYQEAKTKEEQANVYENLVRRLHQNNCYSIGQYNIKEEIEKVRKSVFDYDKPYDKTRLIVDCFNSVGDCIVSGNVRRSSLIALGDAGDQVFLDLKNLTINPERQSIYFLSNNTVRFWKSENFQKYLPDICERIQRNGEPGIANMINVRKFGRYTDTSHPEDLATLLNPCGEICLFSFEPCCLSSVCPYNCRFNLNQVKSPINEDRMIAAAEHATFYATVVTTIRHHWYESNQIIARNRRIGVSYSGVTNIYDNFGVIYLTSTCRTLYAVIRKTNDELTSKLGIPTSIRVTTVKPSGSESILMGVAAGCHFPLCKFGERRVRFDKGDPIIGLLTAAGYPSEQCVYNKNAIVIIFPYRSMGARDSKSVSIYEKFLIATLMQRHFSDNSVSFTGDFSKETESDDVERVLGAFANQIKSVSMFPYSKDEQSYAQIPFTEVPEEQYNKLVERTKPVDWSSFFISKTNKDVSREGTSYCSNDKCELFAEVGPSSSGI